ncbi:MAG TPA: SGNH/GDSL hydrolase family protein [Gemmatimonadaceae bacterium]|nr:SGNH/GDSL hydrolase family protein [Gemmatimonadaceae bacterium]
MTRSIFQYHPTYGFHFIPGVKARIPHESGGYLVRANAAGFRSDREFVGPRSPGRRRILLFGDSYTAGDGVSNGLRYGDLLEKHVPGTEVYNYGLPGTGTDQHYLVYSDVAPRIEHDLVIIAVLVENIRRVVAHYRVFENGVGEKVALAKPYFSLDASGALALHNVPVPEGERGLDSLPPDEREHVDRGGDLPLVRRALNLLGPGVKSLLQSAIGQNPLPAYESPDDPAWRLMRAILARWVSESTAPVLIVPLPLYHYVEGIADASAYQARFAELAAATRAHLHDPLPDLVALPASERRALRFEKDVHPTPLAHEKLALSIAPAVAPLINTNAAVLA